MDLETSFQNASKQSKWFDVFTLIKANANKNFDLCFEYALKCIPKMHPKTIEATVRCLSDELKDEITKNYFSLIELALKSIENKLKYKQIIISLEINLCIFKALRNELENLESKIFEFKQTKLNKTNYFDVNYLSFLFYDKRGKVDQALKYLLKIFENIKMLKKSLYDNLCVKLSKYALISENFYDFSMILKIENDNPFRKIIQKIISGELSNCNILLGDFDKISGEFDNLSDYEINIISKKIKILTIINICKNSQNRFVSFELFIENLGIEEFELICLLLETVGNNLVSGKIDCEERKFYFSRIIEREMNLEEIGILKNKFVCYQKRVDSVLKIF